MSQNNKTVESIITLYTIECRQFVESRTDKSAKEIVDSFKHALKELINREVIGEDEDFISQFRTRSDHFPKKLRNKLREEQRKALDKLFE